MRREISSSTTGLNKVAVLFFFGLLAPIVVLSKLFSENRFDFGDFFGFLLFVFIAFLMIRAALNWKQVEIVKDGLLISQMNFGKRKEIFVPFENIKIIRQNIFDMFNPETVKIEFKQPNEFGDRIKFIPKVRFFPFLEHPIVDELNSLTKFGKYI